MKSKKYFLFIIFLFLITSIFFLWYFGQTKNTILKTLIPFIVKNPIGEQIKKMTLEQKISEILFISPQQNWEQNSWQARTGGVIVRSKEEIDNLKLQMATSSGTRPFIGVDQEGGSVCRLAWLDCTGQQEITNEEEAYNLSLKRGKELADLGINVIFAPVLDISQNQNDFIKARTFSQNPGLLGQIMINGFARQGVIACAKHFPGHGGTQTDSHYQLPTINCDEQCLQERLQPFDEAITGGVQMLMVGHIVINNGLPASLSKEMITDILREELGFDGVVITDDLLMRSLSQVPLLQEKASDKSQDFWWVAPAAVEAVRAGADMVMVVDQPQIQEQTFQALLQAVQKGEISQERLNESLTRILKLKQIK